MMEKNLYKHYGNFGTLVSRKIDSSIREKMNATSKGGDIDFSYWWEFNPPFDIVEVYDENYGENVETAVRRYGLQKHLRNITSTNERYDFNVFGLPNSISTKGLELTMKALRGKIDGFKVHETWREQTVVSVALCRILIDLYSEARNQAQCDRVDKVVNKEGYSLQAYLELKELQKPKYSIRQKGMIISSVHMRRNVVIRIHNKIFKQLLGCLMTTYSVLEYDDVIIVANMGGEIMNIFKRDEFEAFFFDKNGRADNRTDRTLNILKAMDGVFGNSIPREFFDFIDGYSDGNVCQTILSAMESVLYKGVNVRKFTEDDLKSISYADILRDFKLLNINGEIPYKNIRKYYDRLEAFLEMPELGFISDYCPAGTIKSLYKECSLFRKNRAKRLDYVRKQFLRMFQVSEIRHEIKYWLAWKKSGKFLYFKLPQKGLNEVGVDSSDNSVVPFTTRNSDKKGDVVQRIKYSFRAKCKN